LRRGIIKKGLLYVCFGHVGLTTLTARVIEKSTNEKRMDYRLVVIGSLLPDLIDKPIGRILFQNRFESGRVFAHTLAFVLVLISIGLYQIKILYQGVLDKVAKLDRVLKDFDKDYSFVAYIGDDINDLPCMKQIKFAGGVVGSPGDAVKPSNCNF
jgi:hypothetical protein